jgi:hypothetical protein
MGWIMAKRILTVLTAVLAAAALMLAAPAQAAPAMCSDHSDHSDWAFGPKGSTYVTGCGGDSGPDYANNAQIPTIGEVSGVVDADGTHGEWTDSVHADDVRDSPVFVPANRG